MSNDEEEYQPSADEQARIDAGYEILDAGGTSEDISEADAERDNDGYGRVLRRLLAKNRLAEQSHLDLE